MDKFPDPMPVVLVEWVDSQGNSGWESIGEARERATRQSRVACQAAGFLLHEGPTTISLALCQGNEQVMGCMTIPRVAIRKVTYLKGRRR